MEEKPKKKETTLEDLSDIVQRGFTDIRVDLKAIRSDIQEVRTDIANHDQRYDELAESVNRLHEDLSVRRELDRVKEILREKLHVEI